MIEPIQPPPVHRAEVTDEDGVQDVTQDPTVIYESEVDDDSDA